MPDSLAAILEVRERCRRPQPEELARAKGNPSEWNGKPARRLPTGAVSRCTSLHLLAAVGNSVAAWWRLQHPSGKETDTNANPAVGLEVQAEGVTSSGDLKEDDFIAWVPPNLEKDGPYRMSSFEIAIDGQPDAEQLRAEGAAALAIHRKNYTEAGPQRLQLLWWEFPPEHWEALRLGSSMNFLIQPSGHLEFNLPMDEQQLEVASQFVDELVNLGVLVHATEPL
jgi:hypothetical protein